MEQDTSRDAAGKRRRQPTTSSPRANQWVNTGVLFGDRVHVCWVPPAPWRQCCQGQGKPPAPAFRNPGGLGEGGGGRRCGLRASWRRSHPTVIAGELLPTPSAVASHAGDTWTGEGQSLPFISSCSIAQLLLKTKMGKLGRKGPTLGVRWGEENSVLSSRHGRVGDIAEARQAGISAWSWRMEEHTWTVPSKCCSSLPLTTCSLGQHGALRFSLLSHEWTGTPDQIHKAVFTL